MKERFRQGRELAQTALMTAVRYAPLLFFSSIFFGGDLYEFF